MQDDRASIETPFYKRPVFVAVAAFALAWLIFGGSDDDEWEDLDESAYAREGWPVGGELDGFEGEGWGELSLPDVGAAPDFGYEGDPGEYVPDQGGQVPDQGGYGYEEPGAFRGQAEVGGVPMVSGTVDQSGEGNSVYSVGGRVIELP